MSMCIMRKSEIGWSEPVRKPVGQRWCGVIAAGDDSFVEGLRLERDKAQQ